MALIVVGTIALGARPALGADSLDAMTLSDVGEAALQWRLPLLLGLTLLTVALLWAVNVIQPGALKKAGLRDVSPYPWLMWLFAALIVFVTLASAQQFVAQQTWLTGGDPATLRGLGATAIGVYVLTLVVAVGMLTLFARSASGAGLKAYSSDLPLGIGCLLLALPAIFLSSELMVLMHERITGDEITAVAHPMLRKITEHPDSPWVWALGAAAVVGAPIVEEIIYRAFLQSAVLRWTGMPWWSILVTAAVFTGVHAVGEEPVEYYALAPIFVLGIAMGLAYEKTRHIGVPIVMHMGFNALNIGIALYAANGGAETPSTAMGI